MSDANKPVAVRAKDVAGIRGRTQYPAQFRAVVAGRTKSALGDAFGLTGFGVNLTKLEPGTQSALRHWHVREDELVYVVEGELILITDEGETKMTPGMVAGFKAGVKNGHHLVNRTNKDAYYLEVGDRLADEAGFYPDVDMRYETKDGKTQFVHKDGKPY